MDGLGNLLDSPEAKAFIEEVVRVTSLNDFLEPSKRLGFRDKDLGPMTPFEKALYTLSESGTKYAKVAKTWLEKSLAANHPGNRRLELRQGFKVVAIRN